MKFNSKKLWLLLALALILSLSMVLFSLQHVEVSENTKLSQLDNFDETGRRINFWSEEDLIYTQIPDEIKLAIGELNIHINTLMLELKDQGYSYEEIEKILVGQGYNVQIVEDYEVWRRNND